MTTSKDKTPESKPTKNKTEKTEKTDKKEREIKKRKTKIIMTIDDALREMDDIVIEINDGTNTNTNTEVENTEDKYDLTSHRDLKIKQIINDTVSKIPVKSLKNKKDKPETKESKTYVIDTSVILNDVDNIFILSQSNTNTLIIPEIVLDEIDNKKKGFNDVNYQAREFTRLIDQSKVIEKTVYDNVTDIKLQLVNKTELHLVSKKEYDTKHDTEMSSITNDRKILEIAKIIKNNNKNPIVVSNDIALRARSISMDIKSEPLMKDRSDIELISLIQEIDITSDMKPLIEKQLKPEMFGKSFSNFTNVVFNCTDTNEQILTFYKFGKFKFLDEKYLRSFAIKPRNKEQLFFMNMLLDKDIPIIICSGVTGSGKNLLSLVGGLRYVADTDNNKINSGIKYCRNTVTAGDEIAQLGFLKGDENQKLSVFSYPLIDSIGNYIEIVQNNNKNNKNPIPITTPKQFMEDNNISVININQMRGSNVHGYVILDEWQNSSMAVSKLMLTRITEGSKVVVLGDLNQIDNPYLNKFNNGLTKMLKLAQTEDLVAGIQLKKVQRGRIAEFAERCF